MILRPPPPRLSASSAGHRLSETDRWNLALVQRDEVWDQVRMRHLLDSLLSDYPIGAILLCRVKGSSKVIRVDGAARRQEEATEGAWQLLDGQQRINALFSMFTDQGSYGRFHLNMTVERQPPGPVQSRTTKDRALPYIVHGHPVVILSTIETTTSISPGGRNGQVHRATFPSSNSR